MDGARRIVVADPAGGGVVGTWTLDLQKAIDLGMAEAKKKLAELPEGQRKMAEQMVGGKAAREMMEKQLGRPFCTCTST